jgi:hypothetical protein
MMIQSLKNRIEKSANVFRSQKSLSRALKQVAKLPCYYAVRPLFQDPRPGFRRTAVLRLRNSIFFRLMHKVLTYVEYRAVSGVFQNIDPPPPSQPASVSSPRTKGVGGQYFRRSQTLDWPLTV